MSGARAPRRPWFATSGARVPAATLAVDGDLDRAEAVYSHWRDAPPTPPEIADDTATGILVAAARDPERWLDPYERVAIDHVDADGLLAVLVACRPDLVADPARARLLVQAAECGDFGAWHGADAYRVVLRLHRAIAHARALGGAWEQRCLDAVVDGAEAIIADALAPDAERDAQVAHLERARARIHARDGYRVERAGGLGIVAWTRGDGHGDDFLVTRRDDDAPPQALDGLFADDVFQLLAMRVDDGWIHQIDAPRHSWARTVRRPAVAWPDLAPLAQRLAREDASASWATSPASSAIGFTCVLASVDAHGARAPSRLEPAAIAAAWRELARDR